jgi:hypothetical protein
MSTSSLGSIKIQVVMFSYHGSLIACIRCIHTITLDVGCSSTQLQPFVTTSAISSISRATMMLEAATLGTDSLPSALSLLRPLVPRFIQTNVLHGGAAQSRPPGFNRRQSSSACMKPNGLVRSMLESYSFGVMNIRKSKDRPTNDADTQGCWLWTSQLNAHAKAGRH